jgi:hypothetical protein
LTAQTGNSSYGNAMVVHSYASEYTSETYLLLGMATYFRKLKGTAGLSTRLSAADEAL